MTRKNTRTPRPVSEKRATRTRTVVSLSALALLITGGLLSTLVWAGPLNPPAGPVTSTYKTLTEVEPRTAINATNTPGDADSLFKITLPGSYYLTGNITGVVGKHGIEIVASGVALDLNGFALTGVGGSLDGISATVINLTNVAVVNGSIRAWQQDGVDLNTAAALNCRLDALLAQGNTGNGMSIGIGGTVSGCAAFANQGHGILTNYGCTVTDCSAWGNGGSGANLALTCTITNFSAYSNTAAGITAAGECTMTACTTRGGNVGISTGIGSTITGCTAAFSNGIGIDAGSVCTVTNCSAYDNTGHGIDFGSGATLANCSAWGNSGDGMRSAGSASTVVECTVNANSGHGLLVGSGSTVADCTAQDNTLDGIRCNNGCVIRGNNCLANGNAAGDGAGIHATLFDNRIEGNNCTNADRGIDVDAPGNIIIRNTCAGNTTNWTIVANNYYGPIIDRLGVVTAAVNGSAAADTLASSHPNANFSY